MLRQVLAIIIALSFGVAPAFPVLRPIEGLCCRAAAQATTQAAEHTACAVEVAAVSSEHSCCAAEQPAATEQQSAHQCGDADSGCTQVCCYALIGLWACAPPLAEILPPGTSTEHYALVPSTALKSLVSEIFHPPLVV